MHHAAYDVRRRNRPGQLAAGVYRGQARARQRTAKALQKPPGHAVHRGQHRGVGPHQRRDLAHDFSQRRRFDGQHHQVLHPQLCRRGAGGDGLRADAAPKIEPQAVQLQGIQRGAARDHADAAAGTGQTAAYPATNGARAVNANFHLFFTKMLNETSRWPNKHGRL